ncbi:MAG: hypothetical protein ACYCS4_11030 [Acidimicrobiales bacterium]
MTTGRNTTSTERARRSRERRRAEIERARSVSGVGAILAEIARIEGAERDRAAAVEVAERARHELERDHRKAIADAIRQLRIAVAAVASRIENGGGGETDDPDEDDDDPNEDETVPTTATELLAMAAAIGIEPGRVKTMTVQLCGPLVGPSRTPDELARVWAALQDELDGESEAPAPVETVTIEAPAPVETVTIEAPAPVETVTIEAPTPVETVTIEAPAPVEPVVDVTESEAPAPVEMVTIEAPAPVEPAQGMTLGRALADLTAAGLVLPTTAEDDDDDDDLADLDDGWTLLEDDDRTPDEIAAAIEASSRAKWADVPDPITRQALVDLDLARARGASQDELMAIMHAAGTKPEPPPRPAVKLLGPPSMRRPATS